MYKWKGNLFWITLALIPYYSIFVFIMSTFHFAIECNFFPDLHVTEIQDNWEHISKIWGSGYLITRFVSSIVSPVCLSLPFLLLSSVVSSISISFCPLISITNTLVSYCLSLFFFSSLFCSVLFIPQFASFEKAEEIEEFFASHAKSKIARTLKQSIERVHINANWVQSVQREEHLAKALKGLVLRKI